MIVYIGYVWWYCKSWQYYYYNVLWHFKCWPQGSLYIYNRELCMYIYCVWRCRHIYFTLGATANNFSNSEHCEERTKASSGSLPLFHSHPPGLTFFQIGYCIFNCWGEEDFANLLTTVWLKDIGLIDNLLCGSDWYIKDGWMQLPNSISKGCTWVGYTLVYIYSWGQMM